MTTMKRAAVLAALTAVVATAQTLSVWAAPANEAQLRAMFQAKYDARDGAWMQRDADKYLSFCADDYTNYALDGSVRYSSKEQYRNLLVPYMASHTTVKAAYSRVVDVQPVSGGMIVTVAGHKGIDSRCFWVKRNGMWFIKQYCELR